MVNLRSHFTQRVDPSPYHMPKQNMKRKNWKHK